MQQQLQIYLAGTYTFGIGKGQRQYSLLLDHERPIADAVANRLDSYHYVGKQKLVNEIRASGDKIFLDSGAYSAKSLGIEITIEEYVDYIKRNEDIIRVEDGILMAASLDSIGDDEQTYYNQKMTEELGVKTIPTFHQGEDTRYLDYYVSNYEYISLGGIVGGNPKQLEIWLDRMWSNHLIDGSGNPKIRVHGFGMTSVPLMGRYPWYSCDSSSWVQTTAYGGIAIPGYGNIAVSADSPRKHEEGNHLDNLTEAEKNLLAEEILKSGISMEEVRNRYLGRISYNIWSQCEVERRINESKSSKLSSTIYRQELF